MEIIFCLSRRIRRSIWSVLVIAAVIAAPAVFSCVYSDALQQKQTQIEQAYDGISVDVVISNIQGTKTETLNVPDYLGELFLPQADDDSSARQGEIISAAKGVYNQRYISAYGSALGDVGFVRLTAFHLCRRCFHLCGA